MYALFYSFLVGLCEQLNIFSLYLALQIDLDDLSIAQQHREKPTYRIREIRHRGQKVVLVQFAFNTVLYRRCKELGGRYTRTHRGWWWPASERTVTDVKRAISGEATDEKEPINAQSNQPKPPQISSEVSGKIHEMERWMRQKRYSESTVATYTSLVRKFFRENMSVNWACITKDIITRYNHEEFIAKKKSFNPQNQWINAIKLYLKVHGLDAGDLQDIQRPRKVKSLPDILTVEEVRKIFHCTPNQKHRTLLMLIYSCGLRIGETLAIKPADIQSGEGLIYIRGGKGQKDRRVPLSERVLIELRRYFKMYHPGDYLFEGQSGGKYSNRSAAQVLKRAVKRAGITIRLTLHTLRHSYATHLTNQGVNIQYLQEILGHKSPKTTMLYTHLSGKDIRNIKSPLDDMDI